MGVQKKSGDVYIIDFGLAKRYRNPRTNQHIPFRNDRSFANIGKPYEAFHICFFFLGGGIGKFEKITVWCGKCCTTRYLKVNTMSAALVEGDGFPETAERSRGTGGLQLLYLSISTYLNCLLIYYISLSIYIPVTIRCSMM